MSCDSEIPDFEASFNSNVVNGDHRKYSRISYTREALLFLSNLEASKKVPSGFDCSIFSELTDAWKSAPEWTGGNSGDSCRDTAERWDFWKLNSKDSRSIDSEKSFGNQTQHSWQKPGNNGSVGSLQNIEQNGILGSFSKKPLAGSYVSTSKLQGTDTCLLSRCNQPYRPPSFYKEMNRAEANNLSHSSKGASAECPSKERTTEGSWRKETCVGLEENSPTLSCNEKSPLLSSSDNGSIESPNSYGKASEKYLTEESSVSCPPMQDPVEQQLSSQCQLVQVTSGVVIDAVEELQGEILDGGRFSPLISLEEGEDVDAYFLDEKNGNVVDGRGSYRSGSKFILWFPDNEISNGNISAEVNEEIEEGWMVWGATTGKSMKENHSGQGVLQEASTYCQNETTCKKTSSDVPNEYSDGISRQCPNLQEHNLDKTEINQDMDLLPGEAYGLQIAEEADAGLELNLPDEDSLITIDDTYILDQDESKPSRGSLSPISVSNKSIRPESVPNLSLADPWLHKREMKSKSSLVNPPDSLAHVNSPSGFHDPRKFYSNYYTPTISVVSPHSVQLPLKPRKHEPSDDYCPDLDYILSADPSMYHQLLQTPCRNQEPNVFINLPPNQATAKAMDMEIRGLLADKENNSTFGQFLQMQRMLAQLNIEAIEQRVFKTSSNLFQ